MSRDHVCLSSIDWGYLWQGPQEIMTRYARAGSRVHFVEHAGIRRPYLADWKRVLSRLMTWRANPGGRTSGPNGRITVISPVVLPFPWSRVARAINRTVFADRLPRRVRRSGATAPVVWTFVPTPLAIDTLRAFRPTAAARVYYCVADFGAASDDPARMRRSEAELLREVDLVFVGGRVLEKRFASEHRNVVLAPYSVGDHFFGPREPTPADVRSIPRPRIGYVGGLHRHVDHRMLLDVAKYMPDTSFVFVGPKVSGDWPIENLPNAYFLGRREHHELPGVIDALDICLVPYGISSFTETVWPTKLHEYLARGKPVVSTPLEEVRSLRYPEAHVRIAATAAETVLAIRTLLAADGDPAERRSFALQYSWDKTLDRMNTEIEEVIRTRST